MVETNEKQLRTGYKITMALEKQTVFQSNKTAEEREIERRERKRANDRARRMKKAREKQQMLNSNKTPEEREMERREKEKAAEEKEMQRREKKRASDRAYYARTKKAKGGPVKTLEERIEIFREKCRVSAQAYRAKMRESPEEMEAFKERERARGRAKYAKKKEACLTGTGPSKAKQGIKTLTPYLERYKKRVERKRMVERALYARKKKAREEQQILDSNTTPEEREMERREKAKERREKRRASQRASYARKKKAREEQQMLEPNKTPEEREVEKKNCKEQQIFKSNKTPEKRKIEWREKIRARDRALKRKALEEQRKVWKSNKIVDEKLEKRRALDRAHYTKKKEARKIVSETLVEDEIKDLVSDLIKRVDNTLEEGSIELHAKSIKEDNKTPAPVQQITVDHDYAQKSDLKEKTEIKYIRKNKVAYVPSYLLKEFKLSLYHSNSRRKEQRKRNGMKITKELESGGKAQIKSNSRNVLINCASCAEQKSEKNPLEGDSSKKEVAIKNKSEIAVCHEKTIAGCNEKEFAVEREVERREKENRSLREQKILKPQKTPEEREIERREKIRARDRARYAKKKEALKIEKKVKDLLSDLIERVDNTLEEDPSEGESRKNKVCSTQKKEASEERQRFRTQKTPEERKIEWREKIRASVLESKRKAREKQLEIWKSNDLVEWEKRAKNQARFAEMKETRKRVSGTLVEDEIKDFVSDLIKGVDNTQEEGSRELHGKRIKEACKTAASETQVIADHDQRSDLRKINDIVYLRKSAVAVVPCDKIEQFKSSLLRSKPLHDELLERNRIGIRKTIESFLERKAQMERKSQNLLTNCGNPAEQKTETDPMRVDSSKHSSNTASCNEKEAAVWYVCANNKFDEEREIKGREKEKKAVKRREKKRAYEKARYARMKKAREEQQMLNKTPEEREIERIEKEKKTKKRKIERREKEKAYERIPNAKRRKALQEQRMFRHSSNKKKAVVCVKRDTIKSINELESYPEKKTQYLLNNCANPAEQNCETDPLECEKPLQPSLQTVTLKMEVEVEPRQIEDHLLTYVRKEIEPLMHCIHEEHSYSMKIKTEPEELQQTEESLLSYVNKEFMHCMEEEHSQPGTIVTEPEELQQIEESILNFVSKEFVPGTSFIEEYEHSDFKTSTSSSKKTLADRKNS